VQERLEEAALMAVEVLAQIAAGVLSFMAPAAVGPFRPDR
jgi:hypothetical protein